MMDPFIKAIAYQQKEVVCPQPIVFRFNVTQPRGLIDFFLGGKTDV